eukprot:m.503604 g.503604  ORF g.503604 m.503604 type:complete len:78 (+) comp21851_c0_seq1:1771-2004(+)
MRGTHHKDLSQHCDFVRHGWHGDDVVVRRPWEMKPLGFSCLYCEFIIRRFSGTCHSTSSVTLHLNYFSRSCDVVLIL